jgi:hypothetical protein
MGNQFFDIEDLEGEVSASNADEEKSGILAEKYLQLHEERIEAIKQLSGRIPTDGEIFFLWTVNSFNAFTFIPFIIKECGIIQELILSTYSINIRIIDALVKLIDRQLILSVDIFISDAIKSRLPKVYEHLISLVENKPVKVHYSWNHSKIALIRCQDHYFDVEGSGNWGENAQHEQYVFVNSRTVFEFRKKEILHGIDSGTI